ncbi:MAG: diacylglycerol kinase family lipid kinase [Candidatus Omnitrophica bacterium]|nr:diacylglycerol kinase family lipid kinase [Candidatus Omnitrophota bacterium]
MIEIPVVINKKAGRKSFFAVALEALLIRPPFLHKEACDPEEKIGRKVVKAFSLEGLTARPHLAHTLDEVRSTMKRLVAQGEKTIVVAGGDGTFNAAVSAVVGTEVSLGLIPLGTANSLAVELGIPFSVREAARAIKTGKVRTLDLGKAGDHFFAMGAGMSFDAHVIKKVDRGSKWVMGAMAYIVHGILEAFRYPFPLLSLESEEPGGIRSAGYLVIVANARYYGGHFKVASRASLEDGLLDVVVMKRKGFRHLIHYLSSMRYRDVTRLPDVDYFQCRRLRVSSDTPVEIHVDAEIAGNTPCVFECVPKALRMIVPA